ncbi:MAG: [FeFe] hydrogenase H-cluster radical SAM maturase HydE [Myxococcales bacterium]
MSFDNLTREEILGWLREETAERLEELFKAADKVRRERVGDEVHLRGLVEVSNICRRQCGYCGIRAGNAAIERYRMTADEVLDCASRAIKLKYGTVVMQAGEDPGIEAEWMADLIRRIKATTPLAVTLSLGERSDDELRLWRDAGADRYLLRFETSDRALFDLIHPPAPGQVRSDRIAQLRVLRSLGYQPGSGVMIGIPGQSYESLADDLLLFRELDLDMIGVGPFIEHPATPLGSGAAKLAPGVQVPNTEAMTYKVVSLARLVRPDANIPSTTALATLNKTTGRELGLSRGANIVMPNLTPVRYRAKYEIYPGKACINETAEACAGCLERRIRSMGRKVGVGQGSRQKA